MGEGGGVPDSGIKKEETGHGEEEGPHVNPRKWEAILLFEPKHVYH